MACDVIRATDRRHPADAMLRQRLAAEPRRAGEMKSAVSRAVFAYFRWLGWLDRDRPVSGQIAQALDLAARFASRPAEFPDEELVQRAVPEWLHAEMQVTAAWVRAIQAEPRLWLRTRRPHSRELQAGLPGLRSGPLPESWSYDGGEDLFRREEFHRGEFEIQDIASQAVGVLCDPKPGETWWDACAGEGGKTLHLSDLMQNRGLIRASDRAEWRLAKLRRRAARAGVFNYRTVAWDGGARLPMRTRFDGVLVDAPCTGVGTWGRNPHARWTTTMGEVRELADRQLDLLVHAAPAVKPGGALIYAVCTMTRAETTDVADVLDGRFKDFEPRPLPSPFESTRPAAHPLMLWPQQTGGNGMFVASWRRRA